jgi:hypothetical protein
LLNKLKEIGAYYLKTGTIYCAAQNGHLNIIKWLLSQHLLCVCNKSICFHAAIYGQLNVLEWMQTQHPVHSTKWSDGICRYAAEHSHLNILKWLGIQHIHSTTYNNIFYYAVKYGHLDICKWLVNNNAPISKIYWDIEIHFLEYLFRENAK